MLAFRNSTFCSRCIYVYLRANGELCRMKLKVKVQTGTGHEGPEGEYRYSSNLSLRGVNGQRHAPTALPPGKTRYVLYRRRNFAPYSIQCLILGACAKLRKATVSSSCLFVCLSVFPSVARLHGTSRLPLKGFS